MQAAACRYCLDGRHGEFTDTVSGASLPRKGSVTIPSYPHVPRWARPFFLFQNGMHTLCLLDIKVKEPDFAKMARGKVSFLPPRYMSVSAAARIALYTGSTKSLLLFLTLFCVFTV